MASFESSIIIPVYNKWELTRDCLKSLAATTDQNRAEIIVVDNASTDVTPKACQFLGNRLFGQSFKYIRNERNRNFAGASNQGAEASSGKYLVFLNNDTRAVPGWYEPLLEDFANFPDIAATGPVLLYPEDGPFGRTVQHLGVMVTPFLKFGHLFQHIPAASQLVRKRRFFQVITGACMVMEKGLFMEIGKFDENYINGFEDIDLCGRLNGRGCKFTVNPDSLVLHYEGQSQGRQEHTSHNYAHLRKTALRFFSPDWMQFLDPEDMLLKVDEILRFQQVPEQRLRQKLNDLLPDNKGASLKSLLIDYPYWQEGWQAFLDDQTDPLKHLENFKFYFKLFQTVPNAAKAVTLGRKYRNKALEAAGKNFLEGCLQKPGEMLENANTGKDWCERIGLRDLASQYEAWIDNYDYFKNVLYPDYEKRYFSLVT